MTDRPFHFEAMDEPQARFIRRLSGAQRLEISWQMWDWARELVQARVREVHPEWSQTRLDYEVAKRMLGSVPEHARLGFERVWQKRLADGYLAEQRGAGDD
jgi:hypothetical protein